MVHLKKIKINDGFAEADYYPETELKPGHIRVDIATEDIIEHINPEEYFGTYANHARMELVRMAKSGDTRTESMTMWY